MTNIHENCANYNKSKDFCLKWFEENVSEKYKFFRKYGQKRLLETEILDGRAYRSEDGDYY